MAYGSLVGWDLLTQATTVCQHDVVTLPTPAAVAPAGGGA